MGFSSRLAFTVGLLLLTFTTSAAGPAPAAVKAGAVIPGLQLSVTPIADVGGYATFTLTARAWQGPATVNLQFTSPHHGFSGPMQWAPSCACFGVSVSLAQRIHPLEAGTASAVVRLRRGTAVASVSFLVRGLAPGGRTFAPGGTPILGAWLSDLHPLHGQYQHYCAWLHAADAFGISGIRVQFVVHYNSQAQHLDAGRTNSDGLACVHRSIGNPPAAQRVVVDVYAGALRRTLAFTPQG